MTANGKQPGKNASLEDRLAWIMLYGNLTVMDLSRLFDRPYPTVRGWTHGGKIGGAQLDAAFVMAQIEKIERRITGKEGLPVPRLRPSERVRYVEKLARVR